MVDVMKVGWLADAATIKGGAELTQEEFRKTTPDGVEIVDCPPGGVVPGLDVYAIHNCITYSLSDLKRIGTRPSFKYWNDVGNWYPRDIRDWLDRGVKEQICCSYLQAEHMGIGASVIPPPVDLQPFEQAAASMNGNRAGAVSVAAWRHPNKGAAAVAEWGQRNGQHVSFYGGGPFAPPGSQQVAYKGMPQLLAHFDRFVFLPTTIEPFGRTVAEAWAAGCEIVVNRLVGALEWLEGDAPAIRSAAEDYWKLVTSR
jgi:glycosyltransferase involved in cell wall biosynthesis